MTQEDKKLLLKDLSARLPYQPICEFTDTEDDFCTATAALGYSLRDFIAGKVLIKSYLRPMSSMTEEEREELSDYLCEKVMPNKIGITIPPNPTQGKGIPFIWMGDCMEWLNKNMFDYRGLIPMGLALPAPEGMYKID